MKERLVSIIIPVHNEEGNVQPLYEELNRSLDHEPFTFEYIFVDDGSRDKSLHRLEKLAHKDHRIRLVEFARNFGKEAAISAGLHAARGDAAIMIDADLQHPPALIPQFLAKWQRGADVVVGVKRYSSQEPWFKRWASARFYQIMQKVGHTKITPHASDFRLIDRKVMDVFSRLTERNRMTRGLIDWLGFRRAYVHFEAGQRLSGTPSYKLRQLITLAINSFTNYSLLPLKLAGYLGVAILTLGIPSGLLTSVETYVLHDPLHWGIHGTAMLAILTLVLVGLVLACLGLVSLYIANIHAEVTNRPLYVVRRHVEDLTENVPVMALQERAQS